MSNIVPTKPVPSLEEINGKLQTKIIKAEHKVLALEGKVLRITNTMLKQEQKILKLIAENVKLKELKTPFDVKINF